MSPHCGRWPYLVVCTSGVCRTSQSSLIDAPFSQPTSAWASSPPQLTRCTWLLKHYCWVVMVLLIQADVWRTGETRAEARFIACVHRCRQHIFFAWYAQQRRNHSGKKIFALGGFTPGMISLNFVSLITKAVKTRTLLEFLSALHGVAMGHCARPLLRTGEALMQMLTYAWNSQAATTPDIDRPCDACHSFCGTCRCPEELQVSIGAAHCARCWPQVQSVGVPHILGRRLQRTPREGGENVSLSYVASSVAGKISLGAFAGEQIRAYYCMTLGKRNPSRQHYQHHQTFCNPRTATRRHPQIFSARTDRETGHARQTPKRTPRLAWTECESSTRLVIISLLGLIAQGFAKHVRQMVMHKLIVMKMFITRS